MIIRFMFLGLLAIVGINASAQYYYKDLVSNREVMVEMAQLKELKFHSVNVISMEKNGIPTEGFVCQKKFNRNYTEVEIRTSTNDLPANYFTSYFDKEGNLLQTSDSSENTTTNSYYQWDAQKRIRQIKSVTHNLNDDYAGEITEEHIYEYNEKGLPIKMQLVKNRTDSTMILFQPDDNNNVSIEKNSHTGDLYYYYYDSKKRITDVVHKYTNSSKMIPDFVFEYNQAGQLAQMTSSEKEGAYYFIWKYNYDNGLRVRERCFNKERELQGSVEYEYK